VNTKEIKTTGQIRALIANAMKGVTNGDMPVDKATALHKLGRNMSDMLYSEAKIQALRRKAGEQVEAFGDLHVGDPKDK
jgi:hypothetical protein